MLSIHTMLMQKRPLIMGVLNVTPDSFSDGGRYNELDQAVKRAEAMLAAGADIIDIGGESTRPNADIVSVDQELDRVIPVIEKLISEFSPYISIDTSKLPVMQAAVTAGARMVNDVNALQNDGCVDFVASTNADLCLMHMQGKPQTMQQNPAYNDVVDEVANFLMQRAHRCESAGIHKNRIVLDPGFGFGKRLEHNVTLFKEIERLLSLQYPILIGVSRKTMLGEILQGAPTEERLIASITAAIKAAFYYKAQILRVHDVKETAEALKVWREL